LTEAGHRGPGAGRRAIITLVWATLMTFSPPAFATMTTELAVTIDDLPTHGPLPRGMGRLAITSRIIAALKKHGAPGVYGFVNGGQLDGDPELEAILRAWRGAGFFFGNHTFSHLDLTRTSADEYVADIERNEELLARLGPGETWKYFRYPYLQEGDAQGKRNAVRQWLSARGYTIAQVTVYFEDWAWNDAYARCVALDDETAVARLKDTFIEAARASLAWSRESSTRLFGRSIKHILLVHMGAFDALMLDDLLRAYRADGVTLISLGAAVRDPAYERNPDLVWAGERTFLSQLAEVTRIGMPPLPSTSLPEVARLCR
jgi:peptidoglycan-N-acetylglucosamine deacetylase